MHASVTKPFGKGVEQMSNQRMTAERSIETSTNPAEFRSTQPDNSTIWRRNFEVRNFLFRHEADNQPRLEPRRQRTQKIATKIDAFRGLVVFTGWWGGCLYRKGAYARTPRERLAGMTLRYPDKYIQWFTGGSECSERTGRADREWTGKMIERHRGKGEGCVSLIGRD